MISASSPLLPQDPLRLHAVDVEIGVAELHVEIVQQAREAPLFLVAPQPPCKSPHDGLRGETVVDHPFVLDVLPEQRKRFIP